MSESETSPGPDPRPAKPARPRAWLFGSLALLAGVAVLFVVMQWRAQVSARDRAKIEVLRDIEEAKREAARARRELKQAIERSDRERERIEKANTQPYLDDRVVPKDYLKDKALHLGEAPRDGAVSERPRPED